MSWEVHGLPFSKHQSSCSNLKPKMFSWEDDIDLDVELWVDYSLEEGIHTSKKKKYKYAWICESRSIVPFLSRLYETDEKGHKVAREITPTLQAMIDAYDAIFTCDWGLINLHDKIHFSYAGSTLPWTKPQDLLKIVPKKHKNCSFIASNKNICLGHSYRKEIYEYILEHNLDIDVYGTITGKDYFGECDNCWQYGGADGWMDKTSALVDYRYSIVMENDFYPSYFTEKLTDCFATGTIPIYLGSPDVYRWFDSEGIIQVNSLEELKDGIKYYDDNDLWEENYKARLYHVNQNHKKLFNLRHPDDVLFGNIKELSK